jgi:galactokinase
VSEATFFAPGRVNLIGEHLDYNGGRCLPIALSVGTTVRVSTRRDDRVRITSRNLSAAFEGRLSDLRSATGWPAYAAGVLWALQQDGAPVPGLEIEVESTVPVGAGLSSSAALTCGVALGGLWASGLPEDGDEVVRVARRAESEVVGVPTGGLDQTVCVRAQEGRALLIDFAIDAVAPVPWEPEADLLVIDTGVRRSVADGRYAERRAECEAAAARLGLSGLARATSWQGLDGVLARRARHVVTEQHRVTEVLTGDLERIGAAFTDSHISLRDDFEVSCAELDTAVDAALAAGALGARMTGGGFGGAAIALVPRERAEPVREAVTRAFDGRAWGLPRFLDGRACGGARRV